jgi:hypothetical protein
VREPLIREANFAAKTRNPFTNLTAAHNIMAAFALHTRRIKSVKSKQAFRRRRARCRLTKADEQARCRWCDVLDK